MNLEIPILAYYHLPLGMALLARTAGFFVTAPFFSTDAAPLVQRGGLALAVTLVLYPLHQPAELPTTSAGLTFLIAVETGVGLLFGWLVRVFFAALQLAGQIAGFGVGFSLAGVLDPTTNQEDSLGPVLYQYLGLILFLVVGGHRELLRALMESYRILPLGAAELNAPLVGSVLSLVGDMFEMGVRLAAPVATLLFLVDLLLALANRVVPQVPVLMVGMPLKTALGVLALGWGLSAFGEPALAWLNRSPDVLRATTALLGGVP